MSIRDLPLRTFALTLLAATALCGGAHAADSADTAASPVKIRYGNPDAIMSGSAENPYLARRARLARQKQEHQKPAPKVVKIAPPLQPVPAVRPVLPKREPMHVYIPKPEAVNNAPVMPSTEASVTVLERQLQRAEAPAITAPAPPPLPLEPTHAMAEPVSEQPPRDLLDRLFTPIGEALRTLGIASDRTEPAELAASEPDMKAARKPFPSALAHGVTPPGSPPQAVVESPHSTPVIAATPPPTPPSVITSAAPVVHVQRATLDLTQGEAQSAFDAAFSPSAGTEPIETTAPPAAAPNPNAPGTAAAVHQLEISVSPPVMAPAPASTTPAPVPAPAVAAAPTAPATPAAQDASEPIPTLPADTKQALRATPSNLDTPVQEISGAPIVVDHAKPSTLKITEPTTPDVLDPNTATDPNTAKPNPMTLTVEARKPALDLNYEAQRAYNALISGNTASAIEIYEDILRNDPKDRNALFGLAATYHRVGQAEKAKPLYRRLLAIEPGHREALNNFLALAADEAPDQALAELTQLQKRNPDFSPIPAQMALVYQKLGNTDDAIAQMVRAVSLAPENLTYKYNLAILFDRSRKYAEAAPLYKQLIDASYRGETLPGDIAALQQRLTFISSNIP